MHVHSGRCSGASLFCKQTSKENASRCNIWMRLWPTPSHSAANSSPRTAKIPRFNTPNQSSITDRSTRCSNADVSECFTDKICYSGLSNLTFNFSFSFSRQMLRVALLSNEPGYCGRHTSSHHGACGRNEARKLESVFVTHDEAVLYPCGDTRDLRLRRH